MSDFTIDSSTLVKAQIKAAIARALNDAEIPASVFMPLYDGGKEATVPVNIPRDTGTLIETAFLVEFAFVTDVTLISIRVATCECYECMLRCDVAALLADEESAA